MKKQTRIALLAILLIAKISLSGFAQATELRDLQRAAANFSSSLADSLPLNSSLGLNWSDAHIGKLFPSIPPSFGVGVSLGFTTIELSDMNTLADYLGFGGLPNMNRMPFPGYTVEARIGGLFLPFDIGFKFGYLPSLEFSNFSIDYFLIGGDIRYAILNRPFLPRVSVGVGFNYMRGSIGGSAGSGMSFSGGGHTIDISSPDVNLNWSTRSLDFTLQVSQSFLIVTPYLGLGATYAWSRTGYEVRANVSGQVDEVNTYLSSQGIDMDVSSTGMSSDFNNTAFGFRVFGGISLNMAVIRLDFTGIYSFLDGNYGASIGLRFQL